MFESYQIANNNYTLSSRFGNIGQIGYEKQRPVRFYTFIKRVNSLNGLFSRFQKHKSAKQKHDYSPPNIWMNF
jgi:hypothetical protein